MARKQTKRKRKAPALVLLLAIMSVITRYALFEQKHGYLVARERTIC